MSKSITKIALFAVLLATSAFAQYSKSPILSGAGAPTGACSQLQVYVNSSGGDLYTCNSGTWVKGGGTGTVTSVTFTGDGTVLSSTPSGAVTTSGTVTAALASAAGGTVLNNATAASAAPTYTATPVLGVSGTTGTLSLKGATSGTVVLTPQSAAGTPTVTFGTSSGTPAVTASSPLGITAATGNMTCSTCATSSAGGRYSIPFTLGAGNALSPASATTYYYGLAGIAVSATITNELPITAPVACTITGVSYSLLVTSTKDTAANNITFKVYNNTGGSAYADTAGTLTTQTTSQHSVIVTGANDSVAAGDQLLIQLLTPNFTTPPVNVYFNAVVLCQP